MSSVSRGGKMYAMKAAQAADQEKTKKNRKKYREKMAGKGKECPEPQPKPGVKNQELVCGHYRGGQKT